MFKCVLSDQVKIVKTYYEREFLALAQKTRPDGRRSPLKALFPRDKLVIWHKQHRKARKTP
jgi:hypothetical protein